MLTTTDLPAARGRRVRTRVAQVLLTALFVLCALISISTFFAPDPFERDALILIASFGCLAAVLGICATWSAPQSRAAWLGLWALPVFFGWHVAALGTWLPDAVLGVLAVVAVLLLVPRAAAVD